MAQTSAKGNFYAPSPPPQSGGEPALRQWCLREFERIAHAIEEGRSQMITTDVQKVAPARSFEGLVGFFEPGVVGAGKGLYEYRSGAWQKL